MGGLIAMVESMTIKKVKAGDTLVVDSDVWMNGPNDFAFSPRLSVEKNNLVITDGDKGSILTTFALDDEMMQLVERDRSAELKVKFQVRGFHGRLNTIQPIIADGQAKKLAEPRWKTTLPIIL